MHPTAILSNDTEGLAKFAAMNSSIPNIAPKVRPHFKLALTADTHALQGTLAGDFSSVSYNASDPDCWWTYGKCTTPKLSELSPDIADVPEVRDTSSFCSRVSTDLL